MMARILRLACFLIVLVALAPDRAVGAVAERLQPLVTLMIQRLQLSREVAWTKCRLGIPVADAAREARMLTELKVAGKGAGLSPAQVVRLFIPQIAASRRYQEELIAGWRCGIDVPGIEPLDLGRDIRPRLDKVNRMMIFEWAAVLREPLDWADRVEALRMLQERGIPADVAKIAVSPLGGRGTGFR